MAASRDPLAETDVRTLVLAEADLTQPEVERLLEPYGLRQPEQADREIQAIADILPSRHQLADSRHAILEAASRAPDPDRAIHHFRDYATARIDPQAFLSMVAGVPHLLQDLVFVLGASDYLAATLIRAPDHLDWLVESGLKEVDRSAERMLDDLRQWVSLFDAEESRISVLRRFKRRETLRIGVRDLLGIGSVEQTTREMARLAEATFQVAYELLREELDRKLGVPQHDDGTPATFAIVGMGKLGGEELNFSSDVDVLCVYSDEGKTTDGTENRIYFNRLTERLVAVMAEPTQDGYVFRVDLRLRPQGKSGPLARALDSYDGYYESWGDLIDRQALIKARFVAGDEDLGRAFVRGVQPFVYQGAVDAEELEDILEEVGRTKQDIERRIAQDGDPTLHVKLGPGGIRDVEFIVQALQLVHGAHTPSVRAQGTLPAIDALAEHGHLADRDADQLAASYRFMRRVENCIQLVADRQVYSVEDDPLAWELHARRLGYHDRADAGERLREDFRHHQRAIRQAFDRVFRLDEDPVRAVLRSLLDEDTPGEQTAHFLRQYGLTDPDAAHRLLRELARGSERVRFTPRVGRAFRDFAIPLLEHLSRAPEPMLGLLQLERFLSATRARAQYYPLLQQHPPLLELLTRILGTSRFLGEVLIRDPLSFETLAYTSDIDVSVDSLEDFGERLDDQLQGPEEGAAYRVQRFRLAELLRIGTRDILGRSTVFETTRELSMLAEAVLRRCATENYEHLVEHHGTPRSPSGETSTFAIIGMGKLAGRELNYSSDLDVQFVYSDDGETTGGTPNARFFQALARTVVTQLKGPVLGGTIYQLDLRLRPHGLNGPMALSLAVYGRYYDEQGELWERQAVLKSRPVAGDAGLGAAFIDQAHRFAYRSPLTAEEAAEIRHVRGRKEDKAARETDRLRDLKSGYGGVVDIEFLTQAFQLHFGALDARLRSPNTMAAIGALLDAGHVSPLEADALRDSYKFLRFIEDRLQVVDKRPLSALPTDEDALANLAKRMDYAADGAQAPGERLISDYTRRTEAVRELFDAAFDRLEHAD